MQSIPLANTAARGISLTPDQLSADKLQESIAQVVSKLTGKIVTNADASNLSLSEDLLYASIIHQRVEERFPGTGSKFLDSVGAAYSANVKKEKRQPLSKAVDSFLNGMVNNKQMTAAKRDSLIEYAFGKAQLDGRKSTLARTPENPTTRQTLASGQHQLEPILARVAENERAKKSALDQFHQRVSNNPQLNSKQVKQQADVLSRIFPKAPDGAPPSPTPPPSVAGPSETDKPGAIPDSRNIVTGPNDFAYKPESELDSKIVVMLPSRYRDRAVKASIYALDGERELVQMQSPRYGDDQRPYFRSEQSGKDLKGAAIFRVTLVDESVVEFSIKDLGKFSAIQF